MGKYFGLGDDWSDLTAGYTSGGTKALAGLKILGKAVANVGTFAVTEVVPGMIERAGKQTETTLKEKRSEMTGEQVEKAEAAIQNGRDVSRRREEARRADEKIEELIQKVQSLPEGDRVREQLESEIRKLQELKPKWFDTNK